ncbi:hypothetical protein ACTMU2_25650 [Cupriavidus basilensis]
MLVGATETELARHDRLGASRRMRRCRWGARRPGYEIHVLDAAGGAPSGAGQGHRRPLRARGSAGCHLFLAVLQPDPARRRHAAFREDGLFITGDRVRLGGGRRVGLCRPGQGHRRHEVGGENVAASRSS